MAALYPASMLDRTRVVLVHPTLPENVGAVARGMRHFALAELVVVGGVAPTHMLALAAAAGADAILQAARVVDTLEEALAGCVLAIGTTARAQDGVERRPLTPEDGAALAARHARHGTVAWVFGTERTGLTNEQLRRCDQLVTIPHGGPACLNLAQAVTVLAYTWTRAVAAPGEPLAAAGLDHLAEAIAGALAKAGILKPTNRSSKTHALRRILTSAPLTPDDVALLQGLARAYTHKSQPSSTSP